MHGSRLRHIIIIFNMIYIVVREDKHTVGSCFAVKNIEVCAASELLYIIIRCLITGICVSDYCNIISYTALLLLLSL